MVPNYRTGLVEDLGLLLILLWLVTVLYPVISDAVASL